ncbi:hypothetical protein KGA66_12635 [Actinocrinis puniceicyclus]|uniref:Uncharacterized protein n=1 Tax=Actinocrinis puniceicyclus TaxID=977794 RepID=A0A8J7WPF5_9ACTN|nr:hypothetical protein [Actinocrinis puniceicyclus]MBS2963897.1 hypothetical protein [Actinocrinis puniceicyclus]
MTDVSSASYSPHRSLRAALVALVCVGVGATLHEAAGGCHAAWAAIGLSLPAAWVAAWAGLARERSWPALTAALGAAQLALHCLFAHFDAAAAHVTASAPAPADGMPGMTMAQPNGYTAALTMITAHALAVVVCGWWLGLGERDFFALCRAAGVITAAPCRSLRRALAVLATVLCFRLDEMPRICCAAQDRGFRRPPAPLLTTITFRGPPVIA